MCSTSLTTTGSKRQIDSDCQLHYAFKYGSAQKSTKSTPCTNVPITCPHCSETVWKYNAVCHVTLRHKALLESSDLDPQFILDTQLGEEEASKIGVPDELVADYRARHPGLFPDAEQLTGIEARAKDERVSKKRRRI